MNNRIAFCKSNSAPKSGPAWILCYQPLGVSVLMELCWLLLRIQEEIKDNPYVKGNFSNTFIK